jgi:aspartate/methionine/tyrosine aminotransferase
MKLAQRLDHIEPFWVMECAKAAEQIARSPACDPAQGGEPMIFLNIGEPDFTAAPAVLRAAEACLRGGRTQYTQATGLPALRQRIAAWYGTRFGLDIAPERIVVTAGASAALQLVCLALFEAGDEVLMPDPSYPCNRHFVAATGATARLLPSTPAARFQLDAASVAAAWTPATRGVLLASPSNPTGTSIAAAEMQAIAEVVRARGGVTIVDEIYLGLSYEESFGHSALALPGGLGNDVISINSFSKYFSMTGWRLGWMVLPPVLVAPIERMAQNFYICPSSLAQEAALACFEPESIAEYERRRAEFRRRRDFVVPALERIGLPVPVVPDGAFYAWADCSKYSASSWDFCFEMMNRAHVALTPGRDFGPAAAERYLRLSFASSMERLQAALGRLERELA